MDKPTNIKFNLLTGEKIKWVGKPNFILKRDKEPTWLKLISYLIFIYEFGRLSILLFILSYFMLTKALNFKDLIVIPLLILLYIVIGHIAHKSKSSVEFCLTDQRIIFNSWKFYTGKQSNFILLKQIEKLTMVQHKNGVGTIYLHGTNIGTFKNTEHYPGLVEIENSQIVFNKISEMIKLP